MLSHSIQYLQLRAVDTYGYSTYTRPCLWITTSEQPCVDYHYPHRRRPKVQVQSWFPVELA